MPGAGQGEGGAGPGHALARVGAAYLAVVAVLTTVATWAQSISPDRATFVADNPPWLDAWVRWDSGWYAKIAEQGYSYAPGQQSSVAFFPSYPLAVRALTVVTGDVHVSGVLLTLVCGLAGVLLFWNWLRSRLPDRAARLALASLMAYPYAFFIYGAMYGDALFLLCVLAAFTAVERRRYLLAGLIGAVASAGRPVGLALVVGLSLRTVELLAQEATGRHRPGARDLLAALGSVRIRHLGVLTALLGLGGWIVYLWRRFGNPLAFAQVQGSPGWDQGSGPRTWFKIGYGGQLLHGPWDLKVILTAQALVCLLAVLAIPQVWRRFGWGYAAYVVVVLGIPLIGSKDFLGTGRYVMMAFPVFAVLGVLLAEQRRRWVRVVVPLTSALALVVATYFYGLGVLIS